LRLHLDPFGRLVVTLPGGQSVSGITPVRCFPFSAPNERISLCDERGREVLCVPDLAHLPAEARALLEQELARREFLPRVQRILSISPPPDPTQWHVLTDRGEVRFSLASDDQVRRMPPGALIIDTRGLRYRILDVAALDLHSRRLLHRFL
jgi:hypothetical protein